LILDEATGNLDSLTEQKVMETIRDVRADRTTIIITHRLTTVVTADLIVLLDGGRVAEAGTHHQLIRRRGKYYAMLAALHPDLLDGVSHRLGGARDAHVEMPVG
jgi:ATP-binding cassette subfamily B protein